ncbi:uncharacterized protein Tco025E_02725 [Trypanosoma conorhini]|uniref:Uncharacterized protein n=1 Tax=Trypanosoma conorhini TaxID=83891 RepID=A0A422Q175_9TRYP|nr:uncharacterized protein Tco025E_02725 [Trypanosoma conorhini]RNF23765.1 hypothetical protein Tco025E_02725 [Trypanosoma conorhini]
MRPDATWHHSCDTADNSHKEHETCPSLPSSLAHSTSVRGGFQIQPAACARPVCLIAAVEVVWGKCQAGKALQKIHQRESLYVAAACVASSISSSLPTREIHC